MRTVKEWIGKTDDSVPPRAVKDRVFDKFEGVCQCGCGVKIVNKSWDTDHTKPLWLGGENRETNLQPLFDVCHDVKTGKEAGVRAKTNGARFKHRGLKKTKSGRGWPCGKDSPLKRTIGGKVVPRT